MRHANRIPEIERRIVTTQVPCVTFTTLCRRYGFDRVDLLAIDTEGYDWEIVRSLMTATRETAPTPLCFADSWCIRNRTAPS